MKRRNIAEVRRCCNGSKSVRGRAPLLLHSQGETQNGKSRLKKE